MSINEGMAKAQMAVGAAIGGISGWQYDLNKPTPSGDSFTGQMIHLDELIEQQSEILTRLTAIADQLVPGSEEDKIKAAGIGQISPGPDSGPLLFRIQNRTRNLHAGQTKIISQLNRLQAVL